MTELATFRYDDSPIRTVVIDGEPWFIALDLATVLGYRDAHNAARLLDEDEKGTHEVSTPGGYQRVTIISEPGLYALTMRSDMPDAKRFRKWVTHEVLPQIRRTGRYEAQTAIPRTYADALRLAADEHERAERATRELEAAAPKAEAWEVLASAHGDFSVREAAFILNRDPAIDTGQNRLFKLLRDFGLIDRRGIPYAAHERHVRLRARHFTKPSGDEETAQQVRITAEGLRYLHRRMGGAAPLRTLVSTEAA